MQCLSPIYVKNKGYAGCVPCGKCEACRSRRSQQWIFRLEQEASHSQGCLFLTLTYDEEHVPKFDYVNESTGEYYESVNSVFKPDIQRFMHDLRRTLYGDFAGDLRYFCASEYGPTTLRPHYHIILFNFPDISTKSISKLIEECWQKGFVKVSTLNKSRIRYVCKYCLTDNYLSYLPAFNLMSQGIGRDWITPRILFSYRHEPRSYVVNDLGFKISMPRYYIDKLYPAHTPFKHKYQLTIIKQLYETRNNFEDYSQDRSDSFGASYQIDRLQGFVRGPRQSGHESVTVFGEQGAWLSRYYSQLKRSKFSL